MLVVLGPVPGGLRRGPRQPSRLASARASVQLVHSAARLLGERQLSLPPGQGMSARSPVTRSAGCCGGRWYGPFGTLWPTVESPGVVDVVATPRVEAEFCAQLAVDVGVMGRVAGGSGNAFSRGDADAVIDRGGHCDQDVTLLHRTAAPGPHRLIFQVSPMARGERCWHLPRSRGCGRLTSANRRLPVVTAGPTRSPQRRNRLTAAWAAW